jgi:hypothetical protein
LHVLGVHDYVVEVQDRLVEVGEALLHAEEPTVDVFRAFEAKQDLELWKDLFKLREESDPFLEYYILKALLSVVIEECNVTDKLHNESH